MRKLRIDLFLKWLNKMWMGIQTNDIILRDFNQNIYTLKMNYLAVNLQNTFVSDTQKNRLQQLNK